MQTMSIDSNKSLNKLRLFINSFESITLKIQFSTFSNLKTSIDFFGISFKFKSISRIVSPGNNFNIVNFPTPFSPVKRI